MEKDCGAWINLLSHKIKTQLNATFQSLGITGVQSWVIYHILVHSKDGPVYHRDGFRPEPFHCHRDPSAP